MQYNSLSAVAGGEEVGRDEEGHECGGEDPAEGAEGAARGAGEAH